MKAAEPGRCWERANMDLVLDLSGRLEGPVIQTYARFFYRNLWD
jgi:hypothetical protein